MTCNSRIDSHRQIYKSADASSAKSNPDFNGFLSSVLLHSSTMHFRNFATLATAFLAGTSAVVGAPAPVAEVTGSDIESRQLSSITSILGIATSALGPVLSIVGVCITPIALCLWSLILLFLFRGRNWSHDGSSQHRYRLVQHGDRLV